MRKLTKKTKAIIQHTAQLLEENGTMTLRQIYYQFVPYGLKYDQIKYAVDIGRELGTIDVSKIVDRSRPSYGLDTWENPSDVLTYLAENYKLDYWMDQPFKVEIWTEKDTLSQILHEEAEKYRVPVRVTRGYLSISNKAAWSHDRLKILYFGDFDPSGLGIDIDLKNSQFLDFHSFERVGLTLGQIDMYKLPSFKAKKSDNRAPEYIKQYGDQCWELDALPPQILRKLVRESIERQCKFTLGEKQAIEHKHITQLQTFANISKEAVN